jgi:hypothetical protein
MALAKQYPNEYFPQVTSEPVNDPSIERLKALFRLIYSYRIRRYSGIRPERYMDALTEFGLLWAHLEHTRNYDAGALAIICALSLNEVI